MTILVLGLVLFLGVHSVRIVADAWRTRTIARIGASRWKGAYTLVSITGFILIVYGFGLARHTPQMLYVPVQDLRPVNAALVFVALVFFFAARVPRNHFKAAVGHPQALGVAIWSIGHLLVTGMFHDVVLFGAFGLWALAAFFGGRARDRAAGTTYPAGTVFGDGICAAIACVVWAAFAFSLHEMLIGVKVFG